MLSYWYEYSKVLPYCHITYVDRTQKYKWVNNIVLLRLNNGIFSRISTLRTASAFCCTICSSLTTSEIRTTISNNLHLCLCRVSRFRNSASRGNGTAIRIRSDLAFTRLIFKLLLLWYKLTHKTYFRVVIKIIFWKTEINVLKNFGYNSNVF